MKLGSNFSMTPNKTKGWRGLVWTNAAFASSGYSIGFGVRLVGDEKKDRPPRATVAFSVFLVEGDKSEKKRDHSYSPEWNRIAFVTKDQGYRELEYSARLEAAPSKEFVSDDYTWEKFFDDPLKID